jgi:hypothetical protein
MMSVMTKRGGTMRQRRRHGIVCALVVLAAIGCGGPVTRSADGQGETASRIWLVGWEGEAGGVSVGSSQPPEFSLTLTREMPTPGWELRIDSVDVEAATRRIVVKITERGPQGMVAQVITPTDVEIPLGRLAPGGYFVEFWGRRDPGRAHEPAHAVVIRAG